MMNAVILALWQVGAEVQRLVPMPQRYDGHQTMATKMICIQLGSKAQR